jgi:hypothetical protein
MRLFPTTAVILTVVFAAPAGPLAAQQAPDASQQTSAATPAPAPAASPTTDKPTEAKTATASADNKDPQSKKTIHVSKDYIKKLSNIGYYPKNDKGQLVFCKKETPLGTHFERETCMDGDQLTMILEKEQEQRDQMKRAPCVNVKTC